jgi:hypothetical protein
LRSKNLYDLTSEYLCLKSEWYFKKMELCGWLITNWKLFLSTFCYRNNISLYRKVWFSVYREELLYKVFTNHVLRLIWPDPTSDIFKGPCKPIL